MVKLILLMCKYICKYTCLLWLPLLIYPKEDLNLYDIISTKLKFVLSTNSSTRMYKYKLLIQTAKARVI